MSEAFSTIIRISTFSRLGHNTAFTNTKEPIDISIRWIKEKVMSLKKNK
ncbi:hypothetical protein [Tenacibaculum xiamenense]